MRVGRLAAPAGRRMPWRVVIALLAAAPVPAMLSSCAPAPTGGNAGTRAATSPLLLVFAGDQDGRDSDFLAVIDVDPASPRRGQPVATVPIGHRMSMPHHMEYAPPPAGEPLFMNAHHHELSLIVDIADPRRPVVRRQFGPPAPFRYPHDYSRTPAGTRLVGFLRSEGPSPDPTDRTMPGNHGGIAEYRADGTLIRTASAAVPGLGKAVRPYAFALLPQLDRLVVTSAPMMEESWADVLQIYRYSDFRLLHTLPLPPGRDRRGVVIPGSQAAGFGPRVLADGSIFLNSYGCAFYHLTGIGSDRPQLRAVHALDSPAVSVRGQIRGACGIPLHIGHYWVQPVGGLHEVVVFDIARPDAPREVQRLRTPVDFKPHWLAQDPVGDRLVLGAEMGSEQGFYLLRFDPQTGRLAFDTRLRGDRGWGRLGFLKSGRDGYVSLENARWPHGATGHAWGHAALFLGAK